MSIAQMEQLFHCCDTRGTGYLDYEQLRDLCSQLGLDPSETNAILESLDHDRDGKISLQDFSRGFADFLATSQGENGKEEENIEKKQNEQQREELPPGEDSKTEIISDDRLADLYSKLQACDQPHMTSCFEAIFKELMDNVQHLQEENKHLEQSWKREKMEHERHLLTLEEELDCQVKDVEQRAKKKAKEEMEAEKSSLKKKMSDEMDLLQRQLSLFDKVETWLKSNRHHHEHAKLHEVRTKLELAFQENRQLRMSLIETQTTVTLMRGELMQLRSLYEEKCRELDSERGRVLEVMEEQEHLSQQLYRLYDANRKLQDTNDTLRVAVQSSPKDLTQVQGAETRGRKRGGSIIGDYLNNQETHPRALEENRKPELFWEEKPWDGNLQSYPGPDEDLDHCGDDGDSGLYTLRDVSEADDLKDEEEEFVDHHQRAEASKQKSHQTVEKSASDCRKPTRTRSPVSVKSEGKSIRYPVENSSSSKYLPAVDAHPRLQDNEDEVHTSPDRTYKVVFVGDAAVGKSSFIIRLCTGNFVQQLNSTLGVDFRMKTLKVDGMNVTVQLWDTAGQERFRSITQSYFRKVDGVMVLYDCTSERSFLSVRHWVMSITSTATKQIPVMVVANKCDLRELSSAKGKTSVATEEGKQMAKGFGASFIEASAKDGANVVLSLEELCRLMSANEDQDVKASAGLCLESPPKKSSRCCGK